MAKLEKCKLELAPIAGRCVGLSGLLEGAARSCRRCTSEGRYGMAGDILVCQACGTGGAATLSSALGEVGEIRSRQRRFLSRRLLGLRSLPRVA